MATITHPDLTPHRRENEPARLRFFDEATERQLAADDSFAWRTVTGVLITIVTIGLLVAMLTVAIAT